MITKETIIRQLNSTSIDIAKEFDRLYGQELEEFASEMAISYQILEKIINKDDQTTTTDVDFQSALLFWTGLNTYLAALELFRTGYSKEPQMLLRNVIEIFSAAYDIHINPEKLPILQQRPKDFDSKKSIKIAKNIHPIISQMWGMLSGSFSHVGVFHTVPNISAPLCVGGVFEPTGQSHIVCGILPQLNLTLEILCSVLEITFLKELHRSRFWKKVGDDTYQYSPPKENLERGKRIIAKVEAELSKK